jgi:hypothetical protein
VWRVLVYSEWVRRGVGCRVASRRGCVAIVPWMAVNGKQRDVAFAEISKQRTNNISNSLPIELAIHKNLAKHENLLSNLPYKLAIFIDLLSLVDARASLRARICLVIVSPRVSDSLPARVDTSTASSHSRQARCPPIFGSI